MKCWDVEGGATAKSVLHAKRARTPHRSRFERCEFRGGATLSVTMKSERKWMGAALLRRHSTVYDSQRGWAGVA